MRVMLTISTYSPDLSKGMVLTMGEQPTSINIGKIIPTGELRVTPDPIKVTTNTSYNSLLVHISTNTSMTALNR